MNVYFYPPPYPPSRPVNHNPYSDNFRRYLGEQCYVINLFEARWALLDMLKHIFKFDVIIFNWIENIGYKPLGFLQFALFYVLFIILRVRRVKVLWIMHNIYPHEGEKFMSRAVKSLMYKHSSIIVTHSREALAYAKEKSDKRIVFFHHPTGHPVEYSKNDLEIKFDILIWGSIEPYKGVLEFLQYVVANNLRIKIKVIGSCKDDNYREDIERSIMNFPSIDFENRRASFDELKLLVSEAQFTLFPYCSRSVSSSGVLMDTLRFGGSVIGPNRGAFRDLKEEGLCFIFDNFKDVVEIVRKGVQIDKRRLAKFLQMNTWPIFIEYLLKEIKEINN